MKDIRLVQLPNGKFDILLTDGKTSFCEDGEQAIQHAVLRLMKINGESVTGNPSEKGTMFYEKIFRADVSRAEKILHIKNRILTTPGIRKFFTFTYRQTGRRVEINANLDTDWGPGELAVNLEP